MNADNHNMWPIINWVLIPDYHESTFYWFYYINGESDGYNWEMYSSCLSNGSSTLIYHIITLPKLFKVWHQALRCTLFNAFLDARHILYCLHMGFLDWRNCICDLLINVGIRPLEGHLRHAIYPSWLSSLLGLWWLITLIIIRRLPRTLVWCHKKFLRAPRFG